MTDDNNSVPTRRSVLKGVGSATAVTGLSSAVSASTAELERKERRRILQSDPVKRIREELGNPKILSAKRSEGKVRDLSGTVYRFRTPFGELRRVDFDGHTVAQFIFGALEREVGTHRERNESNGIGPSVDPGSVPSSVKRRYEKAFSVASSIYTTVEGSIEYVREATPDEAAALSSVTGFDRREATMGYTSEYDGFLVQRQSKSGSVDVKIVRPDSATPRQADRFSFEEASVENTDLSTLGCDEKACYECAFSVFAAIVGCGATCSLSIPTIAGIVLCVGCALAMGANVGVQCYQCYQTC